MMLKFGKPHSGADFSDGDDDQLFVSPSRISPSHVSPSLLAPSQAVSAGDAPQPTPIVLPDEAVEAEAANAQSGPGGPGSVVALTSGGITINLIFDAAAMAAPASFRAGIQQAASILTASISDQITVNLKIDYSNTGGGAAGGPDSGLYEPYSVVRADLVNNATAGDTTFNALPTGSTFQGQSNVAVWNAQLKLWGILGANDTTTDDGSATFATDINPNLLVGVALHELTHAMGRVPYGPPYGSSPDIFDFDRFTSQGNRLIQGTATAPAAYFSLDGGVTKLADYGQTSDSSDFLNSGVQGSSDPFNEFYSGGTIQSLTSVDLAQLDALGFHLTVNTTTVIELLGSTSLVKVGNSYYLDANSTGSGPLLKISGAGVVAGQYGTWAPIGAEQTAGGYDVAWKDPVSGQYSVWRTDSNGNYLSNLVGQVAGTNTALESLETTFHQDLNGDGIIGLPTSTLIESAGATELAQAGGNYFLESISTGSGPVLKISSAAVVAGQYGTWAPIGAEQTAGGYDVAWKDPVSGQYSVWSTDSNGNYLSNLIAQVSGTNTTLESLETIFHQDLNGDGNIGVPTPAATVIESAGSTELALVGSNYFLEAVTTGSGPVLKLSGAAVVAGQYGTWAPIGAEQTAGGYDVAWKDSVGGQYSVWSTDGNGNYLSNLVGQVAGTNTSLEALETTFHQDLNGDGIIGVPTPTATVIEALGSTSLVQVGSNYYLEAISTGSGPVLKISGATVVAGQYGTWAPIGAEQTAGGYDVAWKDPVSGQYSAWSTDSNGNYLSNLVGQVAGTNTALEALETAFHQDLNGDGTVGIPSAVVAGTSATNSLTEPHRPDTAGIGNDSFHFRADLGTPTADAVNMSPLYLGDLLSVQTGEWAEFVNSRFSAAQEALHSTIEVRDAITNDLDHNSATHAAANIGDLLAGHFLIR
jgi:serralysin